VTVSQAEIDAQRAAIADSFVTRVVLPVAIVVAVALAVGGSLVVAHTIPRLHHLRIGSTRTPVPGTRAVQLQARKYVIYSEVRSPTAATARSMTAPCGSTAPRTSRSRWRTTPTTCASRPTTSTSAPS